MEARPKQTLRQALDLPSCLIASPRDVLQGPFDYAYADTMSVCTRLLSEDGEDDGEERQRKWSYRCFSSRRRRPRRGGESEIDEDMAAAAVAAVTAASGGAKRMLRRLQTFPSTKHCLLQSWSFKKVSPLLSLSSGGGGKWRSFSYEEIEAATDFFDSRNLIGKGGHADVYRGRLASGREVAVKHLVRGCEGEEDDRFSSFLAELGVLGHVSHPNTAALLGFGVDGGLFLVFDFFPRGSLASVLHGESAGMEWRARFKVAIGTAKGLHYLHSGCKRRIIHRDIKASNILLGDDGEPQITDFGLAKWLPTEWTHHTVPVEGTFGYFAPEYFMHGIVDEKTDVFAFGVLLLELITGLRPIDSSQKSLVMKVKPLLESGSLQQLVDSRLKERYDAIEMQRTVLAARLCIRQCALSRPSMEEVVKLLVEGRSATWEKLGAEDEIFVAPKDLSIHAALALDS